MEEQHLSFYKEVSLVLSEEDAQMDKVYRCGECNLSLQGKVSIVQHLLTHENSSPSSPVDMETANGKPPSPIGVPVMNGLTNHVEEDDICAESNENEDHSPDSEEKDVKEDLQEGQELIQIEINPLELISTLIEEDLKSDNPLIPTQHFLLGQSGTPVEENYSAYDEYQQEDYPVGEPPPPEEEPPPPLPLPPVNGGLPLTAESYYDSCPAPGVFQCNQCNEAFKYQYLLTAHKKQCHQGNILTPFKCHVCDNEFTALHDLKRHTLTTHSPDFSHFCQVCGHAFIDPVSLKQHLVDHGKSNRKPNPPQVKELLSQCPIEKTICDGCAVEFPSKSELTRHIVKYQGTCNPNKTDSLRCATCNEEMPTLEALKEHRKASHPPILTDDPAKIGGKKGFQCDYCGKNFSCRSNLRDHLVVHTGDKPYPCDICGKAFSFIHNMKTHRLTHNEGRNEMCPYCDKAYKSKISLYYHMKKGNCRGLSTKEVPEGFRRCTECLQMFASEERFQNHKAKGTCQMSYRCIHCGIRCSSEEKLERHIQKGMCTKSPSESNSSEKKKKHKRRLEHRSEEPVCCERCNNYNRDCCCTFSCRFCNKRVFSISAYITHQRFHISPGSVTTTGRGTSSSTSAPRQKRDRVRVSSILEKRRRKRKKKKKGFSKGKKAVSNPVLPITEVAEESKVCVDEQPSPAVTSVCPENHVNSGTINKQIDHLPPPEVFTANSEDRKSPFIPSASSLIEDDDSTSGSLTDLSTFTAPNLLKPVHVAPTASVGGSGHM